MKSSALKKVLFTTACGSQPYEYIASNTPGDKGPRLRFERHMSYGLRFLQANIPSIEILEYPTWSEYIQALKAGWDIVGFSFYTNEIPTVRKICFSCTQSGYTRNLGG